VREVREAAAVRLAYSSARQQTGHCASATSRVITVIAACMLHDRCFIKATFEQVQQTDFLI